MNTALEPPGQPPRPLPRLAVAAIFRNEAPYVVEWLAHHRVVGVDAFYIADNDSDDGTSELLQALHELGYVKRIPFPSPPGQAPQMPAYAEILGRHAAAEDWVAVIDADEFIMPERDDIGPKDVLACLGERPGVGAVAMSWAIYGSSWLANHAAGLVIERFTRRALQSFEPNLHYKTILRMAAYAGQARNPHHFELKPGWRYVHTNGQNVQFHERHGPGLSQEVVWTGLRLNHYIVKSREEFSTRKQRNGSAASLTRIKDESYFRAYDRNDTRDPVSKYWQTQVHEEMRHILQDLESKGYHPPRPKDSIASHFAPFSRTHGHIDEIHVHNNEIQVRGWAFSPTGAPTERLMIKAGEISCAINICQRIARPDVRLHYPMIDLECGFILSLSTEVFQSSIDSIEVYAIETTGELSGPLPFPGGSRIRAA